MSGENGAPPGQPTPEQLRQQEEQAFVFNQQMLAAMLKDFVPPIDDTAALELAAKTLKEQPKMAEVMQQAVDPTARKQHPFWGAKIFNKLTGGMAFHLEAHKDPRQARYVGEHIQHLQIFSLVFMPHVRAQLYELGYRIEFYQSAKALQRMASASKVQVVS